MSEETRQVRLDAEGALRNSPIFASVDPGSIADLAACTRRVSWPKGAVLFLRGDPGSYLLILTSGRIRLAISTAEGRELVLGHLGAGEMLGEFSLIDAKPRSADASAVEPTSALMLNREDFLRVASARADLGLALARHLCALLRNTNYQMESIALHELRTRVARFLRLALQGQPETQGDAEPELRLGISQGELAAVLGASRPKVNKVLQELHAEGILRRDGDRITCNRDRLERLLAAADGDFSA